MIKRAQTVFISVTMGFVLIIFAGIFLFVNNSLNRAMEIVVSSNIDAIYRSFSQSEDTLPSSGLIITETGKCLYDSEAFSEESIKTFVSEISSTHHSLNKIYKHQNFSYKILSTTQYGKVLIAYNLSQNIKSIYTTNIALITLLIVLSLIIFAIVYLLSFKIFAPIKNAFRKQREFISDASHELKTPIAIISANTDVLLENDDNQYLNNIKSQTTRLNSLVTDLLSLAKLQEGKSIGIVEDFNLSNEITNAVLPFDAVAYEKNTTIQLDIEKDVLLKGDSQSVKKLVNILMDNAVKYALSDTVIKCQLKKENNKIQFSITNSGNTVPQKETSKIFERFYRAEHSRSRESGGSGLGLAIAKNICMTNKWKIYAKPLPDNYISIIVTF